MKLIHKIHSGIVVVLLGAFIHYNMPPSSPPLLGDQTKGARYRDCFPPSPEEMFEKAGWVFRGAVVKIVPKKYLVVEPTQVWKGNINQIPIKIYYADPTGDNMRNHSVGTQYTFFLTEPENGFLSMSYCTYSVDVPRINMAHILKTRESKLIKAEK